MFEALIICSILLTILVLFLTLKEPLSKSLVVKPVVTPSLVKETESQYDGAVTYGEYYTEHICPKCFHILNEDKARYKSKCCYICGYSNCSVLFSTLKVVVRDTYIDGKYFETVLKPAKYRI
jgi:hypothetical protein